MLHRALASIGSQTLPSGFKLEVIISDHSVGPELEYVCAEYRNQDSFEVRYLKKNWNTSSPSSSLNYAFGASSGEIIKILFLDDFLIERHALALIYTQFHRDATRWLACGTIHTQDGTTFVRPHYPRFNSMIHHGNNTISSPSVVALRRECWEPFDDNLLWLMDVDFYKRISMIHGEPTILNEILVATGIGSHQATNTLAPPARRRVEHLYVLFKYFFIRQLTGRPEKANSCER
jgi:glycosyltransferase involved in cell wall biosynthesis